MRKEFALPELDVDFLDANHEWEAIVEPSGRWLIVRNFPVLIGYNVQSVSIALRIEPGYPVSQIDMAYFYPPLSQQNGKPIGALAMETILGQPWQRWSRHRTSENPWRVGLDDVSTHLQMVAHWLERELIK